MVAVVSSEWRTVSLPSRKSLNICWVNVLEEEVEMQSTIGKEGRTWAGLDLGGAMDRMFVSP